jgi:two-component system sensor histidine kinase RegB
MGSWWSDALDDAPMNHWNLGQGDRSSWTFEQTATWLTVLRTLAAVGQVVTITAVALGWTRDLPWSQLAALVALTIATNIALAFWVSGLRNQPSTNELSWRGQWILFGVLLLDLCSLTAMLALTGGPENPFLLFYFVNLAVSGLMLRSPWPWVIAGSSILLLLGLIEWHQPLTILAPGGQTSTVWPVRHQGLAVAFATSALLTTWFITKIHNELSEGQKRLRDSQLLNAKMQRLEALATLAAGAGHELASPLSTIAVVVHELGKRADADPSAAALAKDIALIRSEVHHCRDILARMKSSAGEAAAERLDPVTPDDLLQQVRMGIRELDRVRFLWPPAVAQAKAVLPVQALAVALRNLIQNGLDASAPSGVVEVTLRTSPTEWLLTISDSGHGMKPETLERIGDPFFTTKEPGHGMGLGIFLTQNVLRRLGGELHFESRIGSGTLATVRLPVA